jgi:hypothetical protein
VGSPPPGRRVGRFVSKAIMEGYKAEEQVRGILEQAWQVTWQKSW